MEIVPAALAPPVPAEPVTICTPPDAPQTAVPVLSRSEPVPPRDTLGPVATKMAPAVLVEEPVDSSTEPLAPPLATPVTAEMLPLVPQYTYPVLNIMLPLTPADSAFPVLK